MKNIIKNMVTLVNQKSKIRHTPLVDIFTTFGTFKAKMYEHADQEYLVLISQNFHETSLPYFYIHQDGHECDALEEFCDCHYPIGIALNMIKNEGGIILYSSHEKKNFDELLASIRGKPLQGRSQSVVSSNLSAYLKGYKGEFLTIDFIVKDLNLSVIQLMSDNKNVSFILEQRGVIIMNQASSISFSYGDGTELSS